MHCQKTDQGKAEQDEYFWEMMRSSGIGKMAALRAQAACQSLNVTDTMGGYKKGQQRNKTKTNLRLTTHGTDSVHYVPLFLVPDITLKESNFSITEFPAHIVFPSGLLLKQLFTTSVNTLEICSYTTILSGLCLSRLPQLYFFNTRKRQKF